MTQVDHDYFDWLVSQIYTPKGKTYIELFERMHSLEFLWTVPNDDNRVHDGKDLRSEFLSENRGRLQLHGVSILEVLVALSRRVAFTAGGEPSAWAWNLIKNLHLNKAHDPWTAQKARSVEDILEALVWRTYTRDGRGGFFPLHYAEEDQTKVEIWYQMNAYINERQGI